MKVQERVITLPGSLASSRLASSLLSAGHGNVVARCIGVQRLRRIIGLQAYLYPDRERLFVENNANSEFLRLFSKISIFFFLNSQEHNS